MSAVLGHLAFWDRWVEARWLLVVRAGEFDFLPDTTSDLINDVGLPLWLALPAPDAAKLCLDAAASVTDWIESLGAREVRMAEQTDRPAMLDRSLHWESHAEQIRRLIG